jgi:hypothetical protein
MFVITRDCIKARCQTQRTAVHNIYCFIHKICTICVATSLFIHITFVIKLVGMEGEYGRQNRFEVC